jgi:predicted nuclease of predicted toxin-antitoxin system
MRFLADENIEYPIISILRENKVDILAVREIMKGATDSEITEYAFLNDLLIITSDKDFGELTFRLQKPSCGIILLRISEADCKVKAEMLLAALQKISEDALNKFIVIDKFKIRFRSIL